MTMTTVIAMHCNDLLYLDIYTSNKEEIGGIVL